MSTKLTKEVDKKDFSKFIKKYNLSRLDFHFIPSSHFTSTADVPSPSDLVCHLSHFIGKVYPKGESKQKRLRFYLLGIDCSLYFVVVFKVFLFYFRHVKVFQVVLVVIVKGQVLFISEFLFEVGDGQLSDFSFLYEF